MRYISESDALDSINATLSGIDGYDMAIFSREPTGVATYVAQIAIRMKSSDVTEALLAEIIRIGAREDKPIKFAGTKVDIERDLETTYIFLDVDVIADV